jgi:hypothetical protein
LLQRREKLVSDYKAVENMPESEIIEEERRRILSILREDKDHAIEEVHRYDAEVGF